MSRRAKWVAVAIGGVTLLEAGLLASAAITPSAGAYPAETGPLVASHRGSMEAEPENTLPAFAWAEAVGADFVEVDLRVTADDQIVVMHDRRLNRTTNGHGLVRRHTLAELKALDAGRGYRIPTIDETLSFVVAHHIRLLLDIKDTRRLDMNALVRSVKTQGAQDRVIFGVNTPAQLESVNRAGLRLQTLAFAPNAASIRIFINGGADGVRIWPGWIRRRPELVGWIQRHGAEVWVTTGRLDGARLESVIDRGVDGLITDRPRTALALRQITAFALHPH